MTFSMLNNELLPKVVAISGIHKADRRWVDILFNVFLFIINRFEETQTSLAFANSVIELARSAQPAGWRKGIPLTRAEMQAIKSASWTLEVQDTDFLRDIFEALYTENHDPRHLALQVASKHQTQMLVQVLQRRGATRFLEP